MKLYEPFEKWKHGGVIWVFSDPHFADFDCKLMDKNWISPDEQVAKINAKVGKKDTLIILGDVGNLEYVKKLKGYKVLVTGNHDAGASNYKKVYNEIETPYGKRIVHNGLFDEVYEGILAIGPDIILSHEPLNLPFGVNLHGHNHAGKPVNKGAHSISFNLAANIIGYEPKRLDHLLEGAKYDSVHRLAIDKAIEKKKKRMK